MQAFGDSFDLYTAIADMVAGYWDGGGGAQGLTAGRFAGGRAIYNQNNGGVLQAFKNSGSNDAVHHINFAFMQTTALSGTSLTECFTFGDGATAQCTVAMRSDGAMLLQSGGIGGTTLATFNGALSGNNIWASYEVEVVINNTTGSFTVRANGATSNSFQATGLNTRAGTTNNYASRITIVSNTASSSYTYVLDDFLWRSDASAVPWAGDIRAYVQMPQTDGTAQFTGKSSATLPINTAGGSSSAWAAGTARYTPFTSAYNGTIGSLLQNQAVGYTGNMKCSIFSNAAGVPGTVLGSATAIVNPIAGNNLFTFPTPVAVVKGTQYWVGICGDGSGQVTQSGTANSGWQSTTAYASFPVANPVIGGAFAPQFFITVTSTDNSSFVSEAQQDGLTTYVFDSTVGHGDLYTIPALPAGAVVTAVATRGFMEKGDAGSRSGQMQVLSGATNVKSPALALSTNFLWNWRTDLTDPNTSAAWTAAAVNALQIGPYVQA